MAIRLNRSTALTCSERQLFIPIPVYMLMQKYDYRVTACAQRVRRYHRHLQIAYANSAAGDVTWKSHTNAAPDVDDYPRGLAAEPLPAMDPNP